MRGKSPYELHPHPCSNPIAHSPNAAPLGIFGTGWGVGMARFFQVLWRINAVLAFVALAAFIVFVGLFSKERITKPLLYYFVPPPPVAPAVPERPKPTYSYTLEKNLLIGADAGSADYEIYRLLRWGKIDGRPVTSEAAAAVNFLVTSKKTGANTWLFKGFDRAIVGQEPMLTGRWYWHEPDADDDIAVDIVVLKVVEADSDGDGYLTQEDRQTLYVARFAEDKQPAPEKLLSADAVWFMEQKNKDFDIGYRDHGEGFLAVYSLPDFKLQSKTKIEGLPN